MNKQMKMRVVLMALVGCFVASEAAAIIGAPLTPMSYAGVARRTVRRSYYY
jgi:hypothetical protein